jgi:hypothetical protein
MSRFCPWECYVSRCFSLGTLAVSVGLLYAVAGHAQGLVEYEFTGVVTDNTGNLGVFGPLGTVQIGDTFSGSFSYMTGPGNPDQLPADPELGTYNPVDFELDQAVVPIAPAGIVVRHIPPVATLPPTPPDLGTDGFSVVGTWLEGVNLRVVSLRLEAPYGTVFNDDSLPTMLNLNDFTDLRAVISIRVIGLDPGGMSQIDEGILTSLVKTIPEPSSVVLSLIGLGGFVLLRRSVSAQPPTTPDSSAVPLR